MSGISAFERRDLPRAERVIAAPVADVYAAVEAVEHWSTWVPGVIAPVVVVDDMTFEVSVTAAGRTDRRSVRILAKGPVHTLRASIDGTAQLSFRTRPHHSGTHAEVVLEPTGLSRRRTRFGRRRSTARASEWLGSMLDGLADHLEGRARPT